MSPSTVSGQQPPPRGRIAAATCAVAVTAVAVAGALGLGPGALRGNVPVRDVAVTDRTAAGVAPAAPTTADPTDPTGSDDWLSVEKSAAPPAGTDGISSADVALPPSSGEGKRVVYDISAQRVWLVTGGHQVERTYLVSGAKNESKLDPGSYEVYSTSRHAVSLNNKETMNFMVRFAHGDNAAIGFHDVPAYHDGTLVQSKSALGTPRSGGCIRQWHSDAKALWDFSETSTRVVVTA